MRPPTACVTSAKKKLVSPTGQVPVSSTSTAETLATDDAGSMMSSEETVAALAATGPTKMSNGKLNSSARRRYRLMGGPLSNHCHSVMDALDSFCGAA